MYAELIYHAVKLKLIHSRRNVAALVTLKALRLRGHVCVGVPPALLPTCLAECLDRFRLMHLPTGASHRSALAT